MRTTTFNLTGGVRTQLNPPFAVYSVRYHVPTLAAYSIEYAEMRVVDGESSASLMLDRGFHIVGCDVIRDRVAGILLGTDSALLIVHYHGIRDYSSLFPMASTEKAIRLGLYYEEAEKSFDSGAWLSFLLMCGAIAEGLLGIALSVESMGLDKLIKKAKEVGLVTSVEAETLGKIKGFRNLVHLNRYNEEYISRSNAMDMRTVIDEIIKRFSVAE